MTAKLVSAAELRDSGMLQEVNRLFFHPLGIKLALQAHGGELAIHGFIDDRDDPEGVRFEGSLPDPQKTANVARLWREAKAVRVPALGYMVQPSAGGLDVVDEG